MSVTDFRLSTFRSRHNGRSDDLRSFDIWKTCLRRNGKGSKSWNRGNCRGIGVLLDREECGSRLVVTNKEYYVNKN